MRNPLVTLFLILAPAVAHAQSDLAPLPQNDATISIGWSGGEYPLEDYARWHASLFAGVGAGHYWTDHIKTEIEAAWLSRVNTVTYGQIVVAGTPTYAVSGYRFQDVRLSIAQVHQFGRNAWVHPFLAAGADVYRRDSTEDRAVQQRTVYANDRTFTTVLIPALRESETTVQVRPFAKTGLKIYVSDRGFFTTELKVGFGRAVDHLLWKTGMGFDF
jgi:hypothetical protein